MFLFVCIILQQILNCCQNVAVFSKYLVLKTTALPSILTSEENYVVAFVHFNRTQAQTHTTLDQKNTSHTCCGEEHGDSTS